MRKIWTAMPLADRGDSVRPVVISLPVPGASDPPPSNATVRKTTASGRRARNAGIAKPRAPGGRKAGTPALRRAVQHFSHHVPDQPRDHHWQPLTARKTGIAFLTHRYRTP